MAARICSFCCGCCKDDEALPGSRLPLSPAIHAAFCLHTIPSLGVVFSLFVNLVIRLARNLTRTPLARLRFHADGQHQRHTLWDGEAKLICSPGSLKRAPFPIPRRSFKFAMMPSPTPLTHLR